VKPVSRTELLNAINTQDCSLSARHRRLHLNTGVCAHLRNQRNGKAPHEKQSIITGNSHRVYRYRDGIKEGFRGTS
jgi:hypothetical protein